jgi:membrane protease YdiL (CAAX protease family)
MVVSIALLFVASPISSLIPMPDSIKKDFMTMAYDTGIFSFLLIVIAAPIIEEMVFRGIILDGLLSRYSPFKSILLSSILFGIVHLNPWQFVIALIIGAFSGWIFYKTKNLTLSIIIHATVNLSGYIMRFFVNESSFDESLVESYGGLIGLLGTILLCIFVTVICIFFLRKEFIKQETIQSLNRENENHIL